MARSATAVWLNDALKYLEHWLPQYLEYQREPSLSIALSFQGKPLWAKAWGQANLAKGAAATPNTVYRFASHSKTITAALVMQQVEKGTLRLDEPLGSYLPWLKKNRAYAELSLREVLTHTTGTERDGNDSSFWEYGRPFPSKAELQKYFTTQKPVRETSTQHKYSNYGYALAEMVLEAATGQNYEALVAKQLLKPLGLKSTGVGEVPKSLPLAVGYSDWLDGQRFTLNPNLNAGGLQGVTGFYSTPNEMVVIFSEIVMGKKLLSPRSQKLMRATVFPETFGDKVLSYYGLGIDIFKTEGLTRYGHGGAYPGFITNTSICPDLEVGISIAINSLSGMSTTLTRGIFEILKFFKNERGTKNPLVKYEGQFWSLWGNSYQILAGKKSLAFASVYEARPFTGGTTAKQVGKKFIITTENLNAAYDEEIQFEFKNNKIIACKTGGCWATTDKARFIKNLKEKMAS